MELTHPDTQEMAPVHPEQNPTPSTEHTPVEDTPEYTTPSLKWGLATLGVLIALLFFILALLSTFEPNPRKTLSFAMFIVASALPVFWFTVHENRARKNIQPPLERHWNVIWGFVIALIFFGLALYPVHPSEEQNDDHPQPTSPSPSSESQSETSKEKKPTPQAPLTTKTEPAPNPNDIPKPDFSDARPQYDPDKWDEPTYNYYPEPDNMEQGPQERGPQPQERGPQPQKQNPKPQPHVEHPAPQNPPQNHNPKPKPTPAPTHVPSPPQPSPSPEEPDTDADIDTPDSEE